MPHSDRSPGEDLLVREVVRQVADAAPPAPEWHHLADARVGHPTEPGRPWRQLTLVAAVTALLVSGFWLLVGSDDVELPADAPVTPTLPSAAAPETFEEWVAATDRFDVQLCFARATARLVSDTGMTLFPEREDVPGYTAERARLSAFRAPVATFRAIAAHPAADPNDVASIDPVLEANSTAEAASFGPDGAAPAPSFGDDVIEFERRLALHLAEADDPVTCWFERSEVAPAFDIDVATAPGANACLVAAQLDVAVDDFITADADDDLLRFLQAAMIDYADVVPLSMTELFQAVEAVTDGTDEDRPALAAQVHTVLEPAWAATGAPCEPMLSLLTVAP